MPEPDASPLLRREKRTQLRQCDVCLSKRATDNLSEKSYEEVKRQILNLLSHSPLTPAETADQIKAEKEDIGQVIRYLLDEGELKMQDGMLHISK